MKVLVLFVLILTFSTSTIESVFLRAVCIPNNAPFSDWVGNTCTGIAGDLFRRLAEYGSWDYTVSPLQKDEDPLLPLIVNGTNGTSAADILVGAVKIRSDAMAWVDFPLPFGETTYVMVLSPKYAATSFSLVSAMTSRNVLFITSVILTFLFFTCLVFILCESRCRDSFFMSIPNLGKRLIWALEHAMDTANTEPPLSHQISRSVRCVMLLILLFLVTVFGSILTSDLTTASLNVPRPQPSIAQDGVILYDEDIVRPYLEEMGMVPVRVPNLNDDVTKWIEGTIQADGFITTTERGSYLFKRNTYRTSGYTISADFTLFGAPEAFGFAVSKALDKMSLLQLNVGLRLFRDSGTLNLLRQKYIPTIPANSFDDIPISSLEFDSITITVAVGYAVYVFVAIVFWIVHVVQKSNSSTNAGSGAVSESSDEMSSTGKLIYWQLEGGEWKHKQLDVPGGSISTIYKWCE